MVAAGLLLGPSLCPPGFPSPDLDTTSALLKCLQKPGTAAFSWELSPLPWGSKRSLFPSHLFSTLRSLGRHSPPPPPAQHAEVLTPFHPWFLTPNLNSVRKSRQFFQNAPGSLPALMLNTRPKPGSHLPPPLALMHGHTDAESPSHSC